jgi:hypothetical protein
MNKIESNEVRSSLINLDHSGKAEGCSSSKKIMKVVIPILVGLGVALGVGLPIVLTAPTVSIALLGAAAGVLGGVVVGLIVGLMLKRFFGPNSVISHNKPQPATENQVSPLIVNSFYKQYMLGQEKHLEAIVESISSRLGKNLSEVPHNEKELDQILEFIDQTKLALNRFDDLLKKVDDQSKLDLYLNEESIESKFNVADVLKPLTENQQRDRREALQKVINQAFITRELKQKGKLTNGDENERDLLQSLGFNVEENSNYLDKDLIYGTLKNIVENQLKNESYAGPLSLFKQSLKLCALKARLNAAGINTLLQIEKFQNTTEKYIWLKNKLTEMYKTVSLVLPENFEIKKDSVIVKSLEEAFEVNKLSYRKAALHIFFETIKDQFLNEYLSSKELKDLISKADLNKIIPRRLLIDVCKSDASLTPYIDHYAKWGKYFQVGLIQGFGDSSEILGDGVCAGFCQRFVFNAQKIPDISPEQLAEEVHIKGRDRFFQATLGARWDKLNGTNYKTPLMIEREGYEEKQIRTSTYDFKEPPLENIFPKLGDTLASSAGWVELSLQGEHGHRILVRWDTNRDCYWVLDPNEGLVCFENPQSSHQEAQKLCLDYLKDLFELHYKWLKYINLVQLIKSPDLVTDK